MTATESSQEPAIPLGGAIAIILVITAVLLAGLTAWYYFGEEAALKSAGLRMKEETNDDKERRRRRTPHETQQVEHVAVNKAVAVDVIVNDDVHPNNHDDRDRPVEPPLPGSISGPTTSSAGGDVTIAFVPPGGGGGGSIATRTTDPETIDTGTTGSGTAGVGGSSRSFEQVDSNPNQSRPQLPPRQYSVYYDPNTGFYVDVNGFPLSQEILQQLQISPPQPQPSPAGAPPPYFQQQQYYPTTPGAGYYGSSPITNNNVAPPTPAVAPGTPEYISTSAPTSTNGGDASNNSTGSTGTGPNSAPATATATMSPPQPQPQPHQATVAFPPLAPPSQIQQHPHPQPYRVVPTGDGQYVYVNERGAVVGRKTPLPFQEIVIQPRIDPVDALTVESSLTSTVGMPGHPLTGGGQQHHPQQQQDVIQDEEIALDTVSEEADEDDISTRQVEPLQ